MVVAYWVVTVLQLLFTLFVIASPSYINYIVILCIASIALLITFLYKSKRFIHSLKYVMLFALPLINFIFVFSFHDLNGIITAYIAIALISLYQDFRLIMGVTFINLLSITYGYITGGATMFGGFYSTSGLINIFFTLSIFAFVNIMNARSSKALLDDSYHDKREKEKTNDHISNVLSILKESMKIR